MVGAGVGEVPRKVLPLCAGSPRALFPGPWLAVGRGSQGSVPVRRGRRVGSRRAALPKQCFSVQGLASAFMIYLKFKSMPGPSSRGEGCQEPGRRRGGGREAGLPLCAILALVPDLCTLWRCRAWAPLGSCS